MELYQHKDIGKLTFWVLARCHAEEIEEVLVMGKGRDISSVES